MTIENRDETTSGLAQSSIAERRSPATGGESLQTREEAKGRDSALSATGPRVRPGGEPSGDYLGAVGAAGPAAADAPSEYKKPSIRRYSVVTRE